MIAMPFTSGQLQHQPRKAGSGGGWQPETAYSGSADESRRDQGASTGDAVEPSFFATTEDGLPLRNVIIPTGLIPAFVHHVEPNTRLGIETCGLLMGSLSHNSFTISHLVIPKQTGTTDTCTTTHEEEQFEFQDSRGLLTLGWIHTHPTQSCFMSSLDLHTHQGYQAMLAEAVAIVCSPRHDPGFGVFRLTSPLGIDTIMTCRERGAFHPQ